MTVAHALPQIEVPAPVVCAACGGAGAHVYAARAVLVCGACNGSGFEPAEFVLARTRTHAVRRCVWLPWPVHPAAPHLPLVGIGRGGVLWVRQSRTAGSRPTNSYYAVREFRCEHAGRAFRVAKARSVSDASAGSEAVHETKLGAGLGATCTCEGATYEASAKANGRAWEAGDDLHPTLGCVHLDALHALLTAGRLD